MNRSIRWLAAILLACCTNVALCQEARREAVEPDVAHPPAWLGTHDFKVRHFTFARARHRDPDWATDYPDADLNLVAQIETVTPLAASVEVVPLDRLDTAKISLLYFSRAASLELSESDARSIRDYLESGGFAMFDDSWGDDELTKIEHLLEEIFPQRKLQELPLSHPVFHSVFRFERPPQVLSFRKFMGLDGRFPNAERIASEYPAIYKGVFNDRGRLMAIVCHNTDTADGWEHDGEIPRYLHEQANLKAFPLAINILYVALTQ